MPYPASVVGALVMLANGSVKFGAVSEPLTATLLALIVAAFVRLWPPAFRSACIGPWGVKFSTGRLPAPHRSSTDASARPPRPHTLTPRDRDLEDRWNVIGKLKS